MPVKNTFIHFAAQSKRSLRMCVTDPADPVQARRPSGEEAGSVPHDLADTALEGRPPAIREEIATEPEDPKLPLGPIALDEGDSPADVSVPWNNDELQIQTPEVSPRLATSSPWSTSAPTPASAPSGVTSASSPHPQLMAALAPVSTPDHAIASCSSRTPATPASCSSPAPGCEGLHTFRFTMRLADDTGLGVDLTADASGGLRVQGVLPNGAIDAWNRRCLDGSATAGKVVHMGDFLVCVNNKTDCQGMLGECKGKLLLTLTFVRKLVAEDSGAFAPAEHQPAGRLGRVGNQSPKVFLQIHAALEGERLHASKNLLMQGGQ